MSIVRTLRILASQRPSRPPSSLAAPARVARHRHGQVPVTWIDEELAREATIVHLHGGAYVAGESRAHWNWLEEVARRSGAAGAMVHYRLAPRHRFPVAVDDVLHAVDALVTGAVVRPGRWVLSGDSAGGGLALAVAQMLAGSGAGSPAALLLESPWTDLRRRDGAVRATDHDEHGLRIAAELYAGAFPREDPRLSPILGDLAALPPVHLVNGSQDVLVEGSRALAAALEAAGTEHEYLEVPDAGHDVAVAGEGPAAQEARRSQIVAIRRATGRDRTPLNR
ncbi:alpha/beta hydrolase fold domain-containing protein [Brachybacterium sp. YJGR34]|uniref:alpha/beta hydrolase fold domain-containing protein n=1 Tax=Brachybacterium sp. YJGR34 TaxID=2059911 RepID=UPI000E0B48EA|nr:alpha/beta hydrolase fold domain-containing protein [Brachybacterium sp. YJGR34]